MFRKIRYLAALILLTAGPSQAQQPLTVFAAASLKNALDEAAKGWQAPVVISYGGSGTMARQVAYGAPADVVVLANADWMAWLDGQGGLASKPITLLGNRLVMIGPKNAPSQSVDEASLAQTLGQGRLAIGQTNAVPAGIYGREWLQNSGLWPVVATRLAETENVRAALALVARNEAPLGIVYASDAVAEARVSIVHEISPKLHGPITYPAAVTTVAQQEGAQAFLTYLQSDAARLIFLAHGFLPPPGGV